MAAEVTIELVFVWWAKSVTRINIPVWYPILARQGNVKKNGNYSNQ